MRWMKSNGVDPQRDLMEVGIAFQCLNGGVRMVDADARSTIPGVHVIGELAGGVRGPDRPGGNSLAEGQVFGHRAGDAAGRDALGSRSLPVPVGDAVIQRLVNALAAHGDIDVENGVKQVQETMQRYALVEKSQQGLSAALLQIRDIEAKLAQGGGADLRTLHRVLTLENMATTASIILEACLARQETRSGHLRTDFPDRDDAAFGFSFIQTRSDSGQSRISPWVYPAMQ